METLPLGDGADHGALMDRVYRWQRHIYDVTRKYFLFGRDRTIAGLALAPGQRLLEVGCGTGRNLALALRRWPGVRGAGLDISADMLATARARLPDDVALARADACGFDAVALFGESTGFDAVMVSFALSMIPNWRAAILAAAEATAPGGTVHIVDFGDCAGLPRPLRALLNAWLAHFHVSVRPDLAEAAAALLPAHWRITAERGPFGYFQLVRLTRAN